MIQFRKFLLTACLLPATAAFAAGGTDLREFTVGMPISALPQSGYTGFTCTSDPSIHLPDWQAYKSCPAAANGTREVSFDYADKDSNEPGKTQVAGQPVKLALMIDDQSKLAGIRIETDPHTPLYMHKKAMLFALEVKGRFGEDGWSCQKTDPTETEQPIGGLFIHEHCEKTTATRRFLLDRQVYRDPAKDLRDFTDATQLTILDVGQGHG